MNLAPLELPLIMEGRLWSMGKSKYKSEFHPYAVFLTRAHWNVIPSENFVLSSINKDQLRDL